MSTINPKIMKAVIAITIFGIGSLVLVYGFGINIGGFGMGQITSDGLTWDVKNTDAVVGLGKVVLDIDYLVVNPNDVPVTLDNAEIFIQYNGSKIGGVNVTKEIIESNSNKVISVQLSIDYFEAFGMGLLEMQQGDEFLHEISASLNSDLGRRTQEIILIGDLKECPFVIEFQNNFCKEI